jgi:hypothetical protein
VPDRFRRGGEDIGNPGTGTMSRGEIALGVELRVGLDHGPACDSEIVRESPSGRQPLPRCESPLADRGPQRGLERGAPWPALAEDEFQSGRQKWSENTAPNWDGSLATQLGACESTSFKRTTTLQVVTKKVLNKQVRDRHSASPSSARSAPKKPDLTSSMGNGYPGIDNC